jgi:hypothetical protein
MSSRETLAPRRKWSSTTAEHALGVENMARKSVPGRGVMVDFHAEFGRARELARYDNFMRVLDKDRVVVEQGGML